MEILKVTFDGPPEETSPFVTIHNPSVMPAALLSQVQRYGLARGAKSKLVLSGKLKGSRKAFTEMVQSYGVRVQVVPLPLAQ